MRARLVGSLRKLALSRRMTRLQLCLRLGALASILLFLVLSAFGAKTFLLALQTTTLELRFAERGESWSMPRAVLCRLDPGRATGPDEDCNGAGFAVYERIDLEDAILSFGDGAVLRATVDREDRLLLEIRSAPSAGAEGKGGIRIDTGDGAAALLPEGSRIRIAPLAWRDAGAFAFEGRLQAGAIQSAGRRALMLGGYWEARHSGLLAGSWITGATEVVKTEPLVRGSRVEVVAGDGPARVYGHFTYGKDDEGAHMETVALSARGATGLSVSHYGSETPTVVRPDFIDVAISSPLLLAAAVVLSLLASATQVYADLAAGLRQARGEEPER